MSAHIEQYPLWKQGFIFILAIATTTLCYLIGSYFYHKIKHGSKPNVRYTVHGDINSNNGIMVFIHGYPDNRNLWKIQVAYYTAKKYCCITLENPNYEISYIQNPWGYDTLTLVNALASQIHQLVDSKPIILICHDWGAYFGQLLYIHWKTRINISHLILLDVGDGGDPKQEPHKKRYQFVNAICFLLPRFIGTWVLSRYYSNMLSNTESELSFDDFPGIRDEAGFDSIQGFSYFWIMWTMVFGSRKSKLDVSVHKMLDQMDDVPILFLDALKGWHYPVQYYSQKYKKWIEDRQDCAFVEADCYHWIQDEKIGDTKILHESIDSFLAR